MTKLKIHVEREHTTVDSPFFYLNCNAVLTESAPGFSCSATLDRLNELRLSHRSLKYMEVIFKLTFS